MFRNLTGLNLTGVRLWIALAGAAVVLLLIVGLLVFRVDILRTSLDPRVPFQTYDPPNGPDYSESRAWALIPGAPASPRADDPPADIFFIHPTTYDGGDHWNGPFRDARATRINSQVMLPNYAGPFASAGRVFAPHYRQASLYAQLTLREDAREAREFAYGDVLAAFRKWKADYGGDRPFILVGVEQGGVLAARLLAEEIAPDPALMKRMAATYLIETVVPAEAYGPTSPPPACTSRAQAGCVLAWKSGSAVERGRIRERSLVWDKAGRLVSLAGRQPLCVNPLTGTATDDLIAARANLGAANATGLDWGDRPPLVARAVEAQCEDGVLKVSRPKSRTLRRSGGWADRLRMPPYNLFYADIEADARARVAARMGLSAFPQMAPPITRSVPVRTVPTHRIN
ncbi:MAG: DUF3089 domain-containing protein [Caulobacter sp.]|nr:DUF3089 domain-containing protein [Caulobacter sp.]